MASEFLTCWIVCYLGFHVQFGMLFLWHCMFCCQRLMYIKYCWWLDTVYFSVYQYSKLVIWKFTKFIIKSNISLKWSTVWKWIYSNGQNGILMRVSNQNIVSGLTMQQLPSVVYVYQQVTLWHACRIIPSSTMFGQLQNWNVFSNITCFKVFEPNPDWNWYYGRSIDLCTTTMYRATLLTLWHCWSSVIVVEDLNFFSYNFSLNPL